MDLDASNQFECGLVGMHWFSDFFFLIHNERILSGIQFRWFLFWPIFLKLAGNDITYQGIWMAVSLMSLAVLSRHRLRKRHCAFLIHLVSTNPAIFTTWKPRRRSIHTSAFTEDSFGLLQLTLSWTHGKTIDNQGVFVYLWYILNLFFFWEKWQFTVKTTLCMFPPLWWKTVDRANSRTIEFGLLCPYYSDITM